MRSMKNADFTEQDDGDPAAFAFADRRAKIAQECFYVLPSNVCAGRMGEDCFQCLQIGALHG